MQGVVGLPVEAGVFHGDGELPGGDLGEAGFLVGEVAKFRAGHAEDTDEAFDREEDDGNDEEAAQVFLAEAGDVLEARIAPSVAHGDRLTHLGGPADDAFAEGERRLADGLRVEGAGGAENQAVDGLVVEVDGDLGDVRGDPRRTRRWPTGPRSVPTTS